MERQENTTPNLKLYMQNTEDDDPAELRGEGRSKRSSDDFFSTKQSLCIVAMVSGRTAEGQASEVKTPNPFENHKLMREKFVDYQARKAKGQEEKEEDPAHLK